MNIHERCRLIALPQYVDERGALVVMEHQQGEQQWTRAFWIHHVENQSERGGHAHRTCDELLIAVAGRFEVELFDGKETMRVLLDNPQEALLIPAMVWCRLFNFSSDAVALCFASQEYFPDGYIHDYQEFIQECNSVNERLEE